jgi:hypothetical protein
MTDQSQQKLCPLKRLPCLQTKCALWNTLQKPIMMTNGTLTYPNPEFLQVFEGCGLIHEIPWQTMKLQPAPQTAEEKQAAEAYGKLDQAEAKQ